MEADCLLNIFPMVCCIFIKLPSNSDGNLMNVSIVKNITKQPLKAGAGVVDCHILRVICN